MPTKASDAQPAAKKAASKTRASKTVEKAEETTISHEMPGYKALSEEEMRRDLAEADIYAQAHALIPYQMRGNAGEMYMLMQIAKHLNVPFITALRGLSFIGDKDVKPAMSAQLMSALVRNAGHTLREQWAPETNTATAVLIRKDDPSFEHVAVWDEEKARVAGLWESTPTWVQYPKAMLTARAMSEVCRHAASEVLLGFSYVPEEFQSAESASRVLDMRQQVKADMDRLQLSSEKAIEVLDGVTLPGIPVNLMTPRELEEVNARIGVLEYERDKDKIDEVRERIQRGRDVLGLTEGAFAEIVRRNVRPGRAYDTMNLREAEQVLDVLLRQAKKSGSRSGQRQPVQQTPAPQQQPAQQAPVQSQQVAQQPRPQAQQGGYNTPYMPAQPQEAPQKPAPAAPQAPAPAPVQESYGLCDEAQRPQQYPPLGSQKPEGVSGRMAMIQRTMKEHGVPEGELPIILTYVFGDDERADVANVESLSMADMPAVLEGIQRYAAETVSRPEPTAELPLDGNMDDLEASYNMQGSEVDDDPEETWSAPWPETAKPGGGAN
ncbi:MAG: hypothetical protein HXO64_06650 [Rothia mucilaginosa]|uniref:Uncharacterized protein n=1 Tax=Rothia mucilaginosa TaxID=43675 RepID=A0A930LG07_9MICC|nr:hypothetical protein [Rothia mucilaginosa]MBF1664219.1 hypothetical protein [Rothia mucilaginosa]